MARMIDSTLVQANTFTDEAKQQRDDLVGLVAILKGKVRMLNELAFDINETIRTEPNEVPDSASIKALGPSGILVDLVSLDAGLIALHDQLRTIANKIGVGRPPV